MDLKMEHIEELPDSQFHEEIFTSRTVKIELISDSEENYAVDRICEENHHHGMQLVGFPISSPLSSKRQKIIHSCDMCDFKTYALLV